jgi:hypothetical protein
VLACRDPRLAEHLRAKLDVAASIALDVLEDGALTHFGAERLIEVGGGRHDDTRLFERHDHDALAVEYRDGAVARPEIEADTYLVATLRAATQLGHMESRDRVSGERRRS